MGTVVDDFRWTLTGAMLEEIEPKTIATPGDVVRVDPAALQFIDCPLAEFIIGQFRDEGRVSAELSDEDGDVCLSTAKVDKKRLCLRETLVPRRGQPEHEFTKGHNERHEDAKQSD